MNTLLFQILGSKTLYLGKLIEEKEDSFILKDLLQFKMIPDPISQQMKIIVIPFLINKNKYNEKLEIKKKDILYSKNDPQGEQIYQQFLAEESGLTIAKDVPKEENLQKEFLDKLKIVK